MIELRFKHPDEPYSTFTTQIYTIYGGFMASIGHKLKHMFICICDDKYIETIIEYKVNSGTMSVITKDCNASIKNADNVMDYLENAYGYNRI